MYTGIEVYTSILKDNHITMRKDTRIDDSYRRFMLEEEFKDEMIARKTRYTRHNRFWDVVSNTILVIISAGMFVGFSTLYMLVFGD